MLFWSSHAFEKPTGSMMFNTIDGRLVLAHIEKYSPDRGSRPILGLNLKSKI